MSLCGFFSLCFCATTSKSPAAAEIIPPSLFCLPVPRSGLPRHRLVGMEREGESCFCLLATKKREKLNILKANPTNLAANRPHRTNRCRWHLSAVAFTVSQRNVRLSSTATPHSEQWTEESLMLFSDSSHCVRRSQGAAEAAVHSMSAVKTLEPELHFVY